MRLATACRRWRALEVRRSSDGERRGAYQRSSVSVGGRPQRDAARRRDRPMPCRRGSRRRGHRGRGPIAEPRLTVRRGTSSFSDMQPFRYPPISPIFLIANAALESGAAPETVSQWVWGFHIATVVLVVATMACIGAG